jgi:hypothetical protein
VREGLTEPTDDCANRPHKRHDREGLGFVFRFLDQFTNHGLNHANVSIQYTAKYSTEQGNGEVGREADDQEGEHGTKAADQKDGLSSNSIGQRSPPHARDGLGKGKGRDEDSGEERGVVVISDVKAFDHDPRIWKDGGQGDWLGDSTYCCRVVSHGTCRVRGITFSPRTKSCAVGKLS